MRTKCALGLLVVLLVFTVVVPSWAYAGQTALEWATVDKPGDNGNTVVSPSEVSEVAIGRDDVLYAIDSENARFYRSLDAGVTWEDMTYYLASSGAGLPASKIAVAPDSAPIVAVVTDGGTEVYLSTDGGEDWTGIGVPSLTGTIQALAISREFTRGGKEYREVAIGTAAWGDSATTGEVWVRQMGVMWESWQNQNLTIDPLSAGGEVSALAFSPGYERDATILAVASTGSDVAAAYQDRTWLCMLERDTLSWNALAGYPVELAPAGDAPGVSRVHSSLALPSNYSGDRAESRQLFVSYDRAPDAGDDVYRLNDATPYRLDADGGAALDISSIAYNGTLTSGTLLAGDVNPDAGSLTVPVRRTDDPFDLSPSWELATVPPTGPGNARVGWSPDGKIAYCATSQSPGTALDESALSASLDGDKWRQLGLMDTVIKPADIFPAPDSESLFLTTYSPSSPEGIWRSAGSSLGKNWERLLTIDTAADAVILRLSPDYGDDDTMYVAEAGGEQMAVTHNRGNSWQWCQGAPGPIIDMVVGDEETIYLALPGGYIRKSTNGARTWRGEVETGLPDINMLAIADGETVLVGGKNGDIAYSTDGGESFTRIREVIGSGDVQVVADVDFTENGVIYAATNCPDEGIWRRVIGESTEWEQIDESITGLGDGQSIGSLAVAPEGTLYALRTEPASGTSGGVTRSLNPLEPDPTEVELDLANDALPAGTTFDPTAVFPNTPPYLKLSGDTGQNELWSVDTANQLIYRFRDTLSQSSPSPEMPGNGDIIPVDSSGYITSLTLSWEGLEGATEYEAVISPDPDAAHRLWSETTTAHAVSATRGSGAAQLLSGDVYYWRVRAVAPLKSPWSEIRSLAPALGTGDWSPLAAPEGISPLPGATSVPLRPTFAWQPAKGAAGYEFILARDSGFTDVVVALTGADALPATVWECDRELDYATTYFWRVRASGATSHSEWGTGVFTTKAAPATPPTPPAPPPAPTSSTPFDVYGIILIGAVLVVAILVLAVRTRR